MAKSEKKLPRVANSRMFALFEDLRQKKSNANITTILACWPLEQFFLPLGQLKGRESKECYSVNWHQEKQKNYEKVIN